MLWVLIRSASERSAPQHTLLCRNGKNIYWILLSSKAKGVHKNHPDNSNKDSEHVLKQTQENTQFF